MKTDIEIRNLLERWFAGETTLDEERTLREFFRDDPRAAAEEWTEARALFGYLSDEARRQAPAARVLPLHRRRWAIIAALAACVAVVCTVRIVTTDRPADPTQAVAWIDGQPVTDPDSILTEYNRILAKINIPDINTGARNPALAKASHVFHKLETIGRAQAVLGKLEKYAAQLESIDAF